MVSSERRKIRFKAAIARMMLAISHAGRFLVIAPSRLSRPSRADPAPVIHQVIEPPDEQHGIDDQQPNRDVADPRLDVAAGIFLYLMG
jgi:hypothetical protein